MFSALWLPSLWKKSKFEYWNYPPIDSDINVRTTSNSDSIFRYRRLISRIYIFLCGSVFFYFFTFKHCKILFVVLTKDGAKPIKYGIKLNSVDNYRDIENLFQSLRTYPGHLLWMLHLFCCGLLLLTGNWPYQQCFLW